jgi:predicted DNA-binding ribbon-helix-helix protein
MRQRAKSREGMVTTTVALRGAVHLRLKKISAETGIVMTELVRRAVEEWLRRQRKGKS